MFSVAKKLSLLLLFQELDVFDFDDSVIDALLWFRACLDVNAIGEEFLSRMNGYSLISVFGVVWNGRLIRTGVLLSEI